MTQELTNTTAAPSKPAPQTPALSRTIDVLLSGSGFENGELTLLPGKEIHPEDKRALEARTAALKRSLDYRDNLGLAKIVAGLFANYPSGKATGDEARMTAAAYVTTLSNLPPWAVAEAARSWVRGEAGASAFPPSSAQLYEVASKVVRRFVAERDRIDALLGARIVEVSGDERQRVCEGFDRLRAELRGAVEDRPSRFAEMCAEAGVSPDDIPDAKSAGKRLSTDWLEKEQAA